MTQGVVGAQQGRGLAITRLTALSIFPSPPFSAARAVQFPARARDECLRSQVARCTGARAPTPKTSAPPTPPTPLPRHRSSIWGSAMMLDTASAGDSAPSRTWATAVSTGSATR